jgi:uncharacterized membrane protein YhiD involved in acid resistance
MRAVAFVTLVCCGRLLCNHHNVGLAGVRTLMLVCGSCLFAAVQRIAFSFFAWL